MNEKLRLFIDKLFPPEKKLVKDLTKATKRDKLIWQKESGFENFRGEYKAHAFTVRFKYESVGYYPGGLIGFLTWRRLFTHPEVYTLSFDDSDNGLYAAIQAQWERLRRQKELPNYNLNVSIREILSRVGE